MIILLKETVYRREIAKHRIFDRGYHFFPKLSLFSERLSFVIGIELN